MGADRQAFLDGTAFHFGAVYYRGQENPPREDWSRDHRVAAEDGHTLFRHWVPWNVVEVEQERYRWDDYARMLDLAGEHGINVVLAEMLVDAPEWLIGGHPEARIEASSGQLRGSEMHGSSVNGGHRALCLNHAVVREAAGEFLRRMAERFRGHEALLGYDIWNECSEYTPQRLCFCGECRRSFREWVRRRHGDIGALARRWRRPSLCSYELVELPRGPGLYADFLESIEWRNDDAQEQMRWRRDVLSAADPDALIIAHGNARTHADGATCVGDDFRASENCRIFGYTHYFGLGQTSLLSGDVIRGASAGKVFWRAEAVGGPQWSNRRMGRASPAMDEMDSPEAIRVDALTSMMCGARAYQNPRWRSLLDGPLFGAFGWYGDDGSRTAKSEQVKELAEWARREDVRELWRMKPVGGDVAIVLVDESQAWCYAMQGDTGVYAGCVRGLHRGLTAAGLAADVLKAKQLTGRGVAYVPYPVALADETLEVLIGWARGGGRLVLEACAGYFNEAAHAYPQQPSRELGRVMGVRAVRSSFALDQHDGLELVTEQGRVRCAVYRQVYEGGDAEVIGRWEDGSAGIVRTKVGEGSITLVGAMPSYAMQEGPVAAAWLQSLLGTGREPMVRLNDSRCVARMHEGGRGGALWVLNPGEVERVVRARVSRVVGEGKARALRGELIGWDGRMCEVRIGGREAAVVAYLER